MWIYYIIVIFFVGFAVVDYKKSLFTWAGYSILFHDGICIKPTPPAISVMFALNIYFIAYFFLLKRKEIKSKKKFPFLYPFLFIFLSYFISTFFSKVSISVSLSNTLQILVNDYLIIYLYWLVIWELDDLKSILKTLTIIIILSILYGFYTYLSNTNPIIEFEIALLPVDLAKLTIANNTVRGLKVQSWFFGPSPFAAYCSLIWGAVHICKSRFNSLFNFSNLYIIVLYVLIFSAVLISNTRSGLISFIFISIPFISSRNFLSSNYLLLFLILIFISFPVIETYLPNIYSVFDKDSKGVEGSSVNMRLNQLGIVLNEVSDSPFFGIGRGSMSLIKEKNFEIYGAESVWFWILVERGVFGVISFLYLILSIVKHSRVIKNSELIFIIFYWVILQTMTTTNGISTYFVLFITIFIIKLNYIILLRKKNVIS